MSVQIQLRRDTEANWISSDPVLASGEMALSTDLNQIKIGNGTDNWSDLIYFNLYVDPANGNVGIGTTSPSFKLDLGDGTGSLIFRMNGGAGSTQGTAILIETGSAANVALGTEALITGTGISKNTLLQAYTDSLVFSNIAATPMIFKTTDTERMRILSNGNVGIGTTNPGSKLQVDGLINLKNYTVSTLPASPQRGDICYVTDALAPTFLATIVGGGAITTPVFFNGTNWVGF